MTAFPATVIRKDDRSRQSLFGSQVMQHPAKQSIRQLVHLTERFAVPGGVLLDPFCGSGTVMLAALPVLIGIQSLIAFLHYDVSNVPTEPLSLSLDHSALPPNDLSVS